MTGGSNRGSVRIIDRQKNAVVASISEIPHVYDVDVVAAKKGFLGATSGSSAAALKFAFVSQQTVAIAEYKKQ